MGEEMSFDPEYSDALVFWHKQKSKDFFESIKRGDEVAAINLLPDLMQSSFERVVNDLKTKPVTNDTEAASHIFFSILAPLPNSLALLDKKSKLSIAELELVRASVDHLAESVAKIYPEQIELLSKEWSESTTTNRGGVVDLQQMLTDKSDKGAKYNPFDNVRKNNV